MSSLGLESFQNEWSVWSITEEGLAKTVSCDDIPRASLQRRTLGWPGIVGITS